MSAIKTTNKNNLDKYLFCAVFVLSINLGFGQLEVHKIDDEGWAKGNYVEIGISNVGSFGATTANKPPNFHQNRESDGNGQFGFIANPLKNDWADYDGDYFTPGIPEEGFGIEINGVNYNNNSNNRSVAFDILGKVTSANIITSNCQEDYAQILWEGDVDGLNIKRFYNVTTEGLFIKMTTFIYNTSSETKEDVFFMHNVDPDNNQAISNPYDFKTDIELISQGYLANNVSLIKASQPPGAMENDIDGSHVSFYAKDGRSRVTFGGFFNRSASQIWDGQNYNSQVGNSAVAIDEAISIAFNIGNIAPNETIEITYYYILEDVDENFTPPPIVNISFTNPSVCETDDGEIIMAGLDANATYDIVYEFNQTLVPMVSYTADEFGNILISDLPEGTYANFIITDGLCQTITDIQFELIGTFTSFSADVLVTSDLFSENSSAEVIVIGEDEYQFKLDDGEYQSSNIFNNIPFGLHRFYIRDINECKEVIIEKTLFGYPRFFTPNNDNTNDTWKIEGIDSIRVSKIIIFNRYGKLIKQLSPNGNGWDGTFNGKPLPSSDYWFALYYLDDNNNEKSFKAHFTLKR